MIQATFHKTYMVQLMLGFGIPSTKHSKETLVSGPAKTFFTSSLRCTVGGTAGIYISYLFAEI